MDRDGNWTFDNAQAQLADVIESARIRPQTIVRDGKPAVVVVSAEEWERKSPRRGSLADFLLQSPLRRSDLDFDRIKDPPRDVDF